MAQITPSALISEVRGSIGNQTFARNQYRNYAKIRKSPTNPNTSFQGEIRAIMQAGVIAWQELSESERTEWNRVAKFWHSRFALDGTKPLNGFNYFIRTYITFEQYLSGTGIAPALPRKLEGQRITNVTLNTTTFTVQVSPNNNGVNEFYVIKASSFRSPGRTSINPSLLKPMAVASNAVGVNNINLKTIWETRFGTTLAAHAGEKIFFSIQSLDGLSQYLSPLRITFDTI
jgi:hypothetical protein